MLYFQGYDSNNRLLESRGMTRKKPHSGGNFGWKTKRLALVVGLCVMMSAVGLSSVGTVYAATPAKLAIGIATSGYHSTALNPTNYKFIAGLHDIGLCRGVTQTWRWPTGNVCQSSYNTSTGVYNNIGTSDYKTYIQPPAIANYAFSRWSGSCHSISGSKCYVYITGGHSGAVTAYFTSTKVGPVAAVASVAAVTGNSVTLNWTSGTAGTGQAIQSYTVYKDSTTVATVAPATKAYTITGLSCGQSSGYSVSLYDGYATATSAKVIGSTLGCPTPVIHTTPVAPIKKPTVPSVPSNFIGTVSAGKIIDLSWDAGQAAAGVKEYDLDRSIDQTNWATVSTGSTTSYTDTATDFSTTYYYRLKEVDNNGTSSAYTTAKVTTKAFSSSSTTISTDDKVVTVKFTADTFDQSTDCSVSSPSSGLPTVPTKSLLYGPYNLLCVAEDGSTVDTYKKPISVTVDLSHAPAGYGNYEVQLSDDKSSETTKSKYDSKTHKISFSLTANKTFAVYGKHSKSAVATTVQMAALLALLAAGIGGILYVRRYWVMRSNTVATVTPRAERQYEELLAKPGCTHLGMAQPVQPRSVGCEECTKWHRHWKALRICLVCGHVGCSDDSSGQHAMKHFQETGHPIIYEYGNPAGDSIGWCYVDQTYI